VTGQQKRSRQTRERILLGAAVVIHRDGVQKLTLQRAADEAGVSKGGLLHHFGTKEELLLGLLECTMSDADEGLNSLYDPDSGPGAFARAYLDYVRVPERKPLDSATGVFATAATDPDNLSMAADQFDRWQRRLIEDDGLDPVDAALARVVGDGLWLIDLFGLAPPPPELRSALLDRVAALLRPQPQTDEPVDDPYRCC
jgi:AcrR family transcriptional regulator